MKQSAHRRCNKASNLRVSKDWGFPTPIAVSDSVANETKAFKLLEWERVSCFGHNINLAVQSALQETDARDILGYSGTGTQNR